MKEDFYVYQLELQTTHPMRQRHQEDVFSIKMTMSLKETCVLLTIKDAFVLYASLC